MIVRKMLDGVRMTKEKMKRLFGDEEEKKKSSEMKH
jgi:hypothetical protein